MYENFEKKGHQEYRFGQRSAYQGYFLEFWIFINELDHDSNLWNR